ncbi:TerC family protein [Nocardioides gansuensis]|uniref:TerC family protein n=1 Tax=Nocardioides gansuensis TaxID=2138300 RepID=UPI003183479B
MTPIPAEHEQEPYIVFTANAFALLALRALFFLVKGLLDRLVYLSTGLAVVLGFIGVKLVLHWGHGLDDGSPRSRDVVLAPGHRRGAGGPHAGEPGQGAARPVRACARVRCTRTRPKAEGRVQGHERR